jgi:hypothetical protein
MEGVFRAERLIHMPTCDVCGNDYDKTMVVTQGSRSMTFDSFECAIEGMAPDVRIAAAASSATGLRPKTRPFAVPTVPSNPEFQA